jgi:hypothetical protein
MRQAKPPGPGSKNDRNDLQISSLRQGPSRLMLKPMLYHPCKSGGGPGFSAFWCFYLFFPDAQTFQKPKLDKITTRETP